MEVNFILGEIFKMATKKGSTNQPIEIENNKFILDACCGGRMFWFNCLPNKVPGYVIIK